ncbi:hypothetical protein [Methylopila turkensis]|nr:hypothetical protein [Methylopila turkensis]
MGKGHPNAESADILAYGSQTLFDMKEYFSDLVGEMRRSHRNDKSTSPIRNELGDLYDLIDPKVVGSAIADVFTSRIKEHYQHTYSPFDTTTSGTVLLKWCDEVMSYDDVVKSIKTKRFHAIKMRSLKPLRVGRGGKEIAFRRDQVSILADQLTKSKLQTILQRKYGIPKLILDDLIKKKIVDRSPWLVEEILGPGRLDEPGLQDWIHKIEQRIVDTNGSEPLRLKEAIRHLGTGDAAWRKLIDLIIAGQVPLVGVRRNATHLTIRWLLCRQSLAPHLPIPTARSGTAVTVMLAKVGLPARKAPELARLNVIRTSPSPDNARVSTITFDELDRFTRQFTTPVALASDWGVPVKYVVAWMRQANIQVIGSGKPNIFNLDEVKHRLLQGRSMYEGLAGGKPDHTIFLLQLLAAPPDLNLDDLRSRTRRSNVPKQMSLQILDGVVSGVRYAELVEKFGAEKCQYVFSQMRNRGIERHIVRKPRSQYLLSAPQRADVIDKAREFIDRKNAGEGITIGHLQAYIVEKHGVKYHISNICTFLRRSNVSWPHVNASPRRLDTIQLHAYSEFANKIADRIRSGEPSLTLDTIRDWVLSEFGVSISISTVTKYNRDCNISWPKMSGRKIQRKTGRPEKYRGQQKFDDSQWNAYKEFARRTADEIWAGDLSRSIETIQIWVKSKLDISVSARTIRSYNQQAGIRWPRLTDRVKLRSNSI